MLHVEDITRSKWSQVEELEAQERGEMTKGREVIRVVPGQQEGENTFAASDSDMKGGMHKVLLQDARGGKVWGIELERVKGVGLGMAIGTKVLLKAVTVARGVVLLEPAGCEVLGGKVDAWEKEWRKGRKERLRSELGVGEREGG